MMTTYSKSVNGTAGNDVVNEDFRTTDTLFTLGFGNDNAIFYEIAKSKVVLHGGDDRFYADNASKTLVYGGDGNDRVVTMYGEYVTLDGGAGDDLINYGLDNTYLRYSNLYGGTGNDRIQVIGQTNNVLGGNGDDRLIISGYRNTADGGGDNDIISLIGGGRNIARGGAGNDTIYNTYGGSFNSLYGDRGNDVIYDNNGANELRGGDGNDTIYAYGGNDFIAMGAGHDKAFGGKGNDTYYWNQFDGFAGHDVIVDKEGANEFQFVVSDDAMDDFTFSFDAATQVLKMSTGTDVSVSIETTPGFKNIESVTWQIDGFGTAKIDNNFTSAVAAAIQAYNHDGELEYNNATNKVEISVGGTIIATLPVA
jgi:Ca2+-binding RTX toxin-like protein